jgi:hypothetical protein
MNRILLVVGSWAWITLIHRWSSTFYQESFPATTWSTLRIDKVVHVAYFFYKFFSDMILAFWIYPLHLNIHAIYFVIVAMILIWMVVLLGLVHLCFEFYNRRIAVHPSYINLKARINSSPSNRLVKN